MELAVAVCPPIYRQFGHVCSQCGRPIFIPESSEYVDERRARHRWECDSCGHSFETVVSFPKL